MIPNQKRFWGAIAAINESSDARLVDGDRHNNAERSGAVYVFELPSP